MNRFLFASVVAGLLFSRVASAGDLVRFPGGNAAWTVEITDRDSAAATPEPGSASPRKAKKIAVTQVDGVKRIVITWSDGKVSERWTLPDLPVIFEQDVRDARVVTPVQIGSLENKTTEFEIPHDGSAFLWVKPQLLAEPEPVKRENRDCFHYIGSISYPTVLPGSPSAPIKVEAWIDSRTLLPVALHSETSQSVFTFDKEPPAGPLEIPPVFAQRIARYKTAAGIP